MIMRNINYPVRECENQVWITIRDREKDKLKIILSGDGL
mgnify:CR=1 FL=1